MIKKSNITVCFTPEQFHHYTDKKSTVVVVDVLRATSVISVAFECGVNAIIPVETLDEALKYKKKGFIIAAERDTKPVDGFDFGNSPYHYLNSDVSEKTLVLTTTNGTKAIHTVKNHKVITASFVNIKAVANYLIKENDNVIILCSGWKNIFNLEDTIFAGSLATLLIDSNKFKSNCDSLNVAQQLFRNANGNLFNFLSRSSYIKRNNSVELIKDIHFCLSPTIDSDIIPILKDNKLIKL